jgi:hypothetical protein
MLPRPRVFRHRKWALVWAAGILWLAYDVAGSAPAPQHNAAEDDATGQQVTPDDLAILANAMPG